MRVFYHHTPTFCFALCRNGLVAHLQEVDRLKDATGDASVPIDLLRCVSVCVWGVCHPHVVCVRRVASERSANTFD